MSRSPFSTAAFAQLVRRLRHTNTRYNHIALQFRCRIRPTHHAKRHAYRAGLSIDTTKARACPANYISTLPPAILDHSPVIVPKQRRRDSRQSILLRLPPLKLHLDVHYSSTQPYQEQAPGAPKLLPRQLPEDECGMDDIVLGSSTDRLDSVMTPVYSGLCITIPPRHLKRKLQDSELDENTTYLPQHKRFANARWDEPQRQ